MGRHSPEDRVGSEIHVGRRRWSKAWSVTRGVVGWEAVSWVVVRQGLWAGAGPRRAVEAACRSPHFSARCWKGVVWLVRSLVRSCKRL